MKNRIFKAIASFLVAALAITAVPAINAQAATKGDKGPLKDNYWIEVGVEDTDEFTCIAASNSDDPKKVNGISYNKKTNTLTLKNFKGDNKTLRIFRMGDDFAINVEGTNNLRSITVNPWDADADWGGSLKITGNGTLNLNKKNEEVTGIVLNRRPNSDKNLSLVVDGTVTLNIGAFKGDGWTGDSINVNHFGKSEISIPGLTLKKEKNHNEWKEPVMDQINFLSDWKMTLKEVKPNDATIPGNYAMDDDGNVLYIVDSSMGKLARFMWESFSENEIWLEASDVTETGKTIEATKVDTDYLSKYTKNGETGYYFAYVWGDTTTLVAGKTTKVAGLTLPVLAVSEEYKDWNWDWSILVDAGYAEDLAENAYSGSVVGAIKAPAIAKATISKVTAGSKSATVVAKKVTGAAGYEVRYSTAKSMKNAKSVEGKKTTVKVSKLVSGKKYYVQVRAFKKTSSGAKAYGDWSAVQTVVAK